MARTGAVYRVGEDGAVEDDPIYEPKVLDMPPPALMDRPSNAAKVPTPELDEDKMEDERRALLEGLRADHLERETGVPF